MRLDLAGVTAGYGDVTVLRDVSLTVPSGRVVALIGPNGAGKTTTLGVASGIVPCRHGAVRLGSADLQEVPTHLRVANGLVHITETGATFPGLTVAENLRLFSPKGHEADGLERAIDAFPRLGERLQQTAGTLSGGEQRMLALARSYVVQPGVVLLDELSVGLAPVLVDEIFAFFGRLASEGASLLVVEQYVSKVLAVADLAYLMVRGRITFAGEPGELDSADILEHYLGDDGSQVA